MVCIQCSSKTQVINSRHQKRSNTVWRRRKCLACSAVYTTQEVADLEKSWVVQYLGSKQSIAFERDRLLISIFKSCQHRPHAGSDATGLTQTVINELRKLVQDGLVSNTAIATSTHLALKRFDMAAAIHYEAFHRDVGRGA